MSRPVAMPWHGMPAEPRLLDIPNGPAGLVVGYEAPGVPAVVRLFRARPTAVAVIGSEPVGRLLVAQALAAGAQVAIQTDRPAYWAVLREVCPPRAALTTQPPGAPTPPPGTPHRPSLVVDDVAAGAQVPHREGGRWQAVVALHGQLVPNLVPSLRGYDLVVTHRLAREVVEQVRAATDLSAGDARWLPEMPEQVVALISQGSPRFVRLA